MRMAEKSRMEAEQKMQSEAPPQPPKAPMGGMAAVMAGIRNHDKSNFKKAAPVVQRKPRMDKRDMLMMQLKKGNAGLKKVDPSQKIVKKEEEKDATIFAILNRRQFMADDSESETGSDWSSED